MRNFLFCLSFLGLAACATLSEDECRTGNWFEIGRQDGANGRAEDYLLQHAKACNKIGIAPKAGPWRKGRAEGLISYCRVSNAYRIGTRGQWLAPVCSGDTEELQRANDRGRRWYEIGREIRSVENEIADINARLATLPADHPSRTSLVSERSFLRLDILTLRAQRARYRY